MILALLALALVIPLGLGLYTLVPEGNPVNAVTDLATGADRGRGAVRASPFPR
jgi:hypothetical protein